MDRTDCDDLVLELIEKNLRLEKLVKQAYCEGMIGSIEGINPEPYWIKSKARQTLGEE